MKALTLDFDYGAEVIAIAEYIDAHWNVPKQLDLYGFVDYVLEKGMSAAELWIDRYGNDVVRERLEMREQYLRKHHPKDFKYGDILVGFMQGIWLQSGKYMEHQLGSWRFENKTEQLTKDVRKIFGIRTFKPKGYGAFTKDYHDYQGMEEIDEHTLHDKFNGVKVKESDFPFPVRIALPHVAYDDICQGRKPLLVLVSAIFAHGLCIKQDMNSIAINEYVKTIDITQPFSEDGVGIKLQHNEFVKNMFEVVGENALYRYPHNADFVESTTEVNQDEMDNLLAAVQRKQELDKISFSKYSMAESALDKMVKKHKFTVHVKYKRYDDEYEMEVMTAIIEDQHEVLGKLRFNPTTDQFDIKHISLGYIPFETMLTGGDDVQGRIQEDI